VLLLPLIARSASGATPPPTNAEFEVVEVDLAGQTLNRVLPFDVPFILTGTLPTGVTSLKIQCQNVLTDKEKKRHKPVPPCWGGRVLEWHNTLDPTAPNPTFRVLAPLLEAERFYQFTFSFEKKVTPQDADAFAQKAQGIVDAVLWGSSGTLPASGSLTDGDLQTIREQLIQALREATGADRFVAPGTIFAADTDFNAVRNEFNSRLLPVRSGQLQIKNTLGSYGLEVDSLKVLLDGIRRDPSLQSLRAGLASRAAAEPSAKSVADDVAAAMAIADPPVVSDLDRQSAAALAAFLQKGVAYYSDAAPKMDRLRDLLANALIVGGSPQPFLAPLKLSAADLSQLVAAAQPARPPQPAGPVAAADQSLRRGQAFVTTDLPGLLARRTQAVIAIAQEYRTQVLALVVIPASTVGDFSTQSRNYISADTGVACAPELSACAVYVGTNIYFRPVNKAAPLRQFGNFFQTLDRRVSVTLGLTAEGIGDSGKTRQDLFNTQSLVYGVGARLTNSVRMTVGGLLFKKLSPNPLSTDKKLATTYFLSISFDIDVAPALKGIGGLFTP
jgi:hypothetical protein